MSRHLLVSPMRQGSQRSLDFQKLKEDIKLLLTYIVLCNFDYPFNNCELCVLFWHATAGLIEPDMLYSCKNWYPIHWLYVCVIFAAVITNRFTNSFCQAHPIAKFLKKKQDWKDCVFKIVHRLTAFDKFLQHFYKILEGSVRYCKILQLNLLTVILIWNSGSIVKIL